MKILLTGASGYIGLRLLTVLVSNGHSVVCCVRYAERFNPPDPIRNNIENIEVDFLDKFSLAKIPGDIDGAYFLIHSMSSSSDFEILEKRAGIIVGSGSASFEIIRDLAKKLPVMVAPKWLRTRCQPISIQDVIVLLEKTLFNERTYDQDFDIGGPDILTYKEILLGFDNTRGLKHTI